MFVNTPMRKKNCTLEKKKVALNRYKSIGIFSHLEDTKKGWIASNPFLLIRTVIKSSYTDYATLIEWINDHSRINTDTFTPSLGAVL